MTFFAIPDASASVQLNGDLFAVASDEDNILQFYQPGRPGDPVASEEWINLGDPVPRDGGTRCAFDQVAADQPRRFYRVVPIP